MSNYDDARRLIQDGDLIAVRGQHLIDRLTRLVTRSAYTHTGVAVWIGDRLFMADLNSGRNHLTALSCVPEFDVYAPPTGMDRTTIRAALFDWLAEPIDYGYLSYLVIGLRSALGLKNFIHWRKIIVCSGGSVMVYEMAAHMMQVEGKTPPAAWLEHTRQLSPADLAAELRWALSVRKAAA